MKHIFLISVLIMMVMGAVVTHATEKVPVLNGLFYYQIGGADPISVPPSPILTTIDLSLNLSPAGMMCGKFDPKDAIENFFNKLKSGADDMMIAMQNAATSAIAALPGYLLQKANPGLYDIFQNGLLRGWGKFTLATKSCEQMVAEIGKGKDPYDKWIAASAGDEWKISAGSGGVDIVDAREDIEENKGESGKRWIGGVSCGGRDQEPCHPLRDTVQAGYNISIDRGVLDTSSSSGSSEMEQIWNDPDDVRDWVLTVLGDDEIRTCQGCEPGSIPGKGLIPLIADRRVVVEQNFWTILNGGLEPTPINLALISAPGVGIGPHVIDSINKLSEDKEAVVARISSEVAMSQVMQEAMIVRRLLLTGRKEGSITGIGVAQASIEDAIAELETEIANVTYENDIRKSMVSETVLVVLEKARSIENVSRGIKPVLNSRNRDFNNGRVIP